MNNKLFSKVKISAPVDTFHTSAQQPQFGVNLGRRAVLILAGLTAAGSRLFLHSSSFLFTADSEQVVAAAKNQKNILTALTTSRLEKSNDWIFYGFTWVNEPGARPSPITIGSLSEVANTYKVMVPRDPTLARFLDDQSFFESVLPDGNWLIEPVTNKHSDKVILVQDDESKRVDKQTICLGYYVKKKA